MGDEISALSTDLLTIAGKLTARGEEGRRTRSFVEQLPLPVLVLNSAGMITFFNRAARNLIGCDDGELIGRAALSLFANPEDEAWIRGERGDEARKNLWLRKDGHRVPVSVRVGFLGAGDREGGAVLVATDITERERVQESLRESERRHRSMFDDSPISLWMEDFSLALKRIRELRDAGVRDFARYFKDHPGEVRHCASLVKIVDVNRATLALYEAESKDQLLRDLTPLFRAETWTTFTGELLAIAAGETRYECDTEALTPKGKHKHTNLTWSVVPGFEATYGRVLVSIIDITERVRALAGLRRERDTLRKYMDVSRSIFLVLDLEGKVMLINRTGCEILGYPMEEIVGRDWFSNFTPERVRGELKSFFDRARSGETQLVFGRDNPVLTQQGTERQIEWQNTVLADDVGTVYGVLSSGHDVTEQKKMEEHLFHARKMESVGTLAGGIAHDFNNILAGIVGYAYLAKQSIPVGSRTSIDLDAIERLAMRGSSLTKALLAFSRGGDYNPESLALNDCAEEVLQVMERTARPHIEIRRELAADLRTIFTDKLQFHQCLMNLCINAVEAMPEGGTLTVKTARVTPDADLLAEYPGLEHGACSTISISDTGVGMCAVTRERLFDPFFTTKPDRIGNGLGLPMVHGIVERIGGALTVESAPGKGSMITLYLPEQVSAGGREARPKAPAPGGRTILLVDDESDFRDCAARWLARLGYRVLEASSGEEAVKIVGARAAEIGLVLLDMVMRGGGGVEAFRAMRRIAPGLQVLICSGYALDSSCQELIRDGALGFVQKPFEHSALAERICVLLGPGVPSDDGRPRAHGRGKR